MNQIPLPDLVAQIGQASVAEAFGISPAAVHKAIRLGRKIMVTVHDDGSYTAHEQRPFPHHKAVTVMQAKAGRLV
ncbi:Cro/CI family transcriptional regulator [Pseudomonas ficuserectae]|jgi:hypothetical protein|nr:MULTISPECIES: Cro/CI family transcriptional regulator [Pseudomonas syringae group]ARA80059.1 Cro/Cl family transcriptional regulator [Pseudomonas amygdali pv. lachrymans]AXH56941.1 Cro/Cl family transcriptional regulator [Pseudomonas amygdali pv. lachrymans str. M301315]KKY58609.1 Cro/Cl family transcriptional regulator [Pseudomonas amygdali pv. lachrymans]KWS38913.1 Cro/Cl family transcriptional regulator [Pseudomonas syringae pv. papulans]MBI6798150.1 Cro/Cl family transcriptional regulat